MSRQSEIRRQQTKAAKLNMQLVANSYLAQGMYAACKVIYDKIHEEPALPAEELVKWIDKFCEPSIKNVEETKDGNHS